MEPGQAAGPGIRWAETRVSGDRLDAGDISTVAKGAGITFLGRATGTGLRYSFATLAARALGAHDYGLYALGLSIVQMVSLLSLLGPKRGVVRYVAMFRASDDRLAERGVVILATAIVGVSRHRYRPPFQ